MLNKQVLLGKVCVRCVPACSSGESAGSNPPTSLGERVPRRSDEDNVLVQEVLGRIYLVAGE